MFGHLLNVLVGPGPENKVRTVGAHYLNHREGVLLLCWSWAVFLFVPRVLCISSPVEWWMGGKRLRWSPGSVLPPPDWAVVHQALLGLGAGQGPVEQV